MPRSVMTRVASWLALRSRTPPYHIGNRERCCASQQILPAKDRSGSVSEVRASPRHVRFPLEADTPARPGDVRFGPEAEVDECASYWFWSVDLEAPHRAPAARLTRPCTRKSMPSESGWLAKPYDHQDMVRALADARDRSRDLEL